MAEEQHLHEPVSKWKMPVGVFFKDARRVFKWDTLGKEILQIAFPAALAVAADPVASLIDTAFIGHIGPVELAAAGVSIALFNQASRITIFPLVSITTSFVAEEDTVAKMNTESAKGEKREKNSDMLDDMEKGAAKPKGDDTPQNGAAEAEGERSDEGLAKDIESKKVILENVKLENAEKGAAKNSVQLENGSKTTMEKRPSDLMNNSVKTKIRKKKRHIASASTALIFGAILGLFQAIFLMLTAKVLLGVMGVKPGSPMLAPAQKYLRIRSIGAPAVLLTLAMQGIFRGFKDTKTPLYVIVAGYAVNIALDPLLIFVCGMGIRGAAMAHVISQYLMALVLFIILTTKVDLLPPSLKDLQFGRFLKNGTLLLARVVAVTFCVTLAASLAARLGPTPMAAFQTCLQVWLTSSLLADGLAVAGQAILACAFAEKDYKKATATATRVLQMSFILGVGLAFVVGIGLYFGAGVFSRDVNVLHLIKIGLPFVAATQPINSLSFVFDGVNFGASDFAYAAYSLVLVAIASIVSLFLLSKSHGFVGIWIALTIYMALRTFAGVWRMGTGTGPWRFLKGRSPQ
ncbi:protein DETOXIFICATION 43-like isoform X3 [Malus sylvestris]|uniref:protein DETOXIFICATION 43-like isoform X3 n=1 Tax=Malus domestica TaxID=3750 RepID=UPI000498A705|nr:protein DETOXIFICATION 43-like isoform X3 [Malus domestica]XP_050153199.1 protein DETOXIFICATION 43-like isoform X3 [Malus sylvestris]